MTFKTPPVSRLLDLTKLQCSIFSHSFNPDRLRLGTKVLRQRLKGPQLVTYYPRRTVTTTDIQKAFAKFDLETWDEEEEDRLESIQMKKMRGKGAPKKKRTAEASRKFNKGKKR